MDPHGSNISQLAQSQSSRSRCCRQAAWGADGSPSPSPSDPPDTRRTQPRGPCSSTPGKPLLPKAHAARAILRFPGPRGRRVGTPCIDARQRVVENAVQRQETGVSSERGQEEGHGRAHFRGGTEATEREHELLAGRWHVTKTRPADSSGHRAPLREPVTRSHGHAGQGVAPAGLATRRPGSGKTGLGVRAPLLAPGKHVPGGREKSPSEPLWTMARSPGPRGSPRPGTLGSGCQTQFVMKYSVFAVAGGWLPVRFGTAEFSV